MRLRSIFATVFSVWSTLALHGCTASSDLHRAVWSGEINARQATPRHANLDIWSWNIAAEALNHLIPEFERQDPGVHVRVNMNGARLQSRLLLALSSGVGAPDISQLQLV